MPRYDDNRYDCYDRYDDDHRDRYDRYDDGRYDRSGHYARHGTKLYVGSISPHTQIHELRELFSRYGRVQHVYLKEGFGFVEFADPRAADDAIHDLDGREFNGSRIIVDFARGYYPGPRARGPPRNARCYNCGIEGHWAQNCQAGDWKNRCYKCGEEGHVERNCQNSRKDLKQGRSYSRSPSPRHGRGRSQNYSRSRWSYSHLRSPRRDNRGADRVEPLSRSPGYGQELRYPPPRDAERNGGSSYHGGSPSHQGR